MTQILLDTNVYISYFIDRNKAQREIAVKYFSKLQNKEVEVILPALVLAEIVYILSDYYNFEREKIVFSLASIVSEDGLIMENKDIILTTLEIFRESSLDFADAYLVAFKEHKNCELITFDKKLQSKV
jgi:predicted nucleic-acid-binding protein